MTLRTSDSAGWHHSCMCYPSKTVCGAKVCAFDPWLVCECNEKKKIECAIGGMNITAFSGAGESWWPSMCLLLWGNQNAFKQQFAARAKTESKMICTWRDGVNSTNTLITWWFRFNASSTVLKMTGEGILLKLWVHWTANFFKWNCENNCLFLQSFDWNFSK